MTESTPSAGHAPGLPALSRRNLLRASPALLAPGLLAGKALASSITDTPLLRLFREWDAGNTRINGATLSDDEFNDAMDELRALRRRIRAEPVTCLQDLAAKLVAACWHGDMPLEGASQADLVAECEALVAEALVAEALA